MEPKKTHLRSVQWQTPSLRFALRSHSPARTNSFPHDASTLREFVEALVADREDELRKERITPSYPSFRGENGWENGTIEAFLGAACAWAESTDFGRTQDLSESNPRCRFAAFLYRGKIYE